MCYSSFGPKLQSKTFNKTASLMAFSCQAVALLALSRRSRLAEADSVLVADSAFCFGKNLGLAFQLVDDWLDFTQDAEQLGKPAAADLR